MIMNSKNRKKIRKNRKKKCRGKNKLDSKTDPIKQITIHYMIFT